MSVVRPVFATVSHPSWDRLVSLGAVEEGVRCVTAFILERTGSPKSPVQLLLWKKTCFLLGWDSLNAQSEQKQVTSDALIAGIYGGNGDKSPPLQVPLPLSQL